MNLERQRLMEEVYSKASVVTEDASLTLKNAAVGLDAQGSSWRGVQTPIQRCGKLAFFGYGWGNRGRLIIP